MEPSRRDVLRGGVALGVLGALGPRWFPPRRAPVRAVRTTGTTLERTLLRGPVVNAGGYRHIVVGPGEPFVVRGDLGTKARTGRDARRQPVVAFVQLTDMHIVDAQSPARVEFLDRYNDDPGSFLPFSAAYRAQEMLTAQDSDALIRAARRIGRGPVTGLPLAFTICTGDNVDNCQFNELRWHIDLLDGRPIRYDSGDLTKWEGVHDQTGAPFYDVHYWHPDGTPSGSVDDRPRSVFGFPVVKGLLAAARRPFTAGGAGMPWYTAYGNHDGLLQGNAPPNAGFNAIAVGSAKAVALPVGMTPGDVAVAAAQGPAALLGVALGGVPRTVTPDPRRHVVTRAQTIAEYFRTTGKPVGHGFTPRHITDNHAYYTFDITPKVLGIVLDTVNPGGYADGSIDATQFTWLQQQLRSVSKRYLDAAGQPVAGGRLDRLCVIFSHHTVGTMSNPVLAPGETAQRVLGAQVRDVLLRFPNVVLWVNGHTHVNNVIPHPRAAGPVGGFWEVNTASHTDWPHQARLLEIADNRDGTLSIFATVIDGDAPPAYGGRLDSLARLASLGRELAANDWQDRARPDPAVDGRRGRVEQRNVELLVAAPFDLRAAPGKTSGGAGQGNDNGNGSGTGGGGLSDTGARETTAEIALALAVAGAGIAAARRRDESDIGEA